MEPLKQVYKLALPNVGGDNYYCIFDKIEDLFEEIKVNLECDEFCEFKIVGTLITEKELEEMGEFPGW